MANKDRPRGFEPQGQPKKVESFIAGSEIFQGDAVKLSADGKIDSAGAGEDIFGIAMGYASGDGERCNVSTDPNQLYVGQGDETEFSAQTDIGQKADILATAGDSTYKSSRQEIDSSTKGGAGNDQVIIMGIRRSPNNDFGGQVDVFFKINENQIYGETDSAGV